MKRSLLRGGLLVTMNAARDVFEGDVRFEGDRIVALAPKLKPAVGEKVIDTKGCLVIPGLIQAHVHLCQTLFRGLADDLELLDWLEQRIWPLENAHDAKSLSASARIGLFEMQLSGTTSILDMGTVRHHDAVFAEAEKSGVRYWGGNCLMDLKETSGPLSADLDATLVECRRLIKKWHRKTPLLNYAVSPRFAISCSDQMLKAAVKLQTDHDLLMHTHASENRGEIALIKKRSGLGNVQFLDRLGLLGSKTVIAHGIHLEKSEVRLMVERAAGLTHCPSSNLKLASGIAPIQNYLKAGMKVALGADGAACSNGLDAFMELRLAALLQKPLFGPTALNAREAFELATLGGAKVLNAEDEIGSLEVGKQADIVVVKRDQPATFGVTDPYSNLVYSCTGRDVRDVWIAGRRIVSDREHFRYRSKKVLTEAARELSRLLARLKKTTMG